MSDAKGRGRRTRRCFCELPLNTPIELRHRFGAKKRISTIKFTGLEYTPIGQIKLKIDVNNNPSTYTVGGEPLYLGRQTTMFTAIPFKLVPSSIFCDMMQPYVVFEMPHNVELVLPNYN